MSNSIEFGFKSYMMASPSNYGVDFFGSIEGLAIKPLQRKNPPSITSSSPT
jgi:hypothetical protein